MGTQYGILIKTISIVECYLFIYSFIYLIIRCTKACRRLPTSQMHLIWRPS